MNYIVKYHADIDCKDMSAITASYDSLNRLKAYIKRMFKKEEIKRLSIIETVYILYNDNSIETGNCRCIFDTARHDSLDNIYIER